MANAELRDIGADVRRAERDEVRDRAIAAEELDEVTADHASHRVADDVDLRRAGQRLDLLDEPAELARSCSDPAQRPVLEADDRPEPDAREPVRERYEVRAVHRVAVDHDDRPRSPPSRTRQ